MGDVSKTDAEHEENQERTYRSSSSKTIGLQIAVAILAVLACLLIIALIIVTLMMVHRHEKQREFCMNEGCVRAAGDILQKMNPSADPCEDFHKFTCGNWIENHGGHGTGLLEETIKINRRRMKEYLTEESKEKHQLKCVQKVLKALDVCMAYTDFDANTFQATLRQIGGWPMMDKRWNEHLHDWTELYSKAFTTFAHVSPLYFLVTANSFNTSENVFHMRQPPLNVPLNYEQILLLAKLGDVDNFTIFKDLEDLEWIDKLILNMSLSDAELIEIGDLEATTIENLYELFPENNVDWLRFFNNLFSSYVNPVGYKIGMQDRLLITGVTYVRTLIEMIRVKRISKRMLSNYAAAKLIQILNEVHPISVGYDKKSPKNDAESDKPMEQFSDDERWTTCFDLVIDTARFVIDYIHGKHRKLKLMDEEMTVYLSQAMNDMVETAKWLDSETKKAAQEKLTEMVYHLNFSPWTQDPKKLEEYHKKLPDMSNNSFENQLALRNFKNLKHSEMIVMENNKMQWPLLTDLSASSDNVFYYSTSNAVVVPAAVQIPPIFLFDRPMYMNYAGLGYLIGHELTHGFDKKGSTRDKFGNIRNWRKPETLEEFDERSQCFVDQYNSYHYDGVNGRRTLPENIADNVGVQQASLAYKKWEKKHGKEKPLPGLEKYNNYQLFFMSYAGLWCNSAHSSELSARMKKDDLHAAERLRVIGPLSNMKEFADLFNCKPGSRMNPKKKCVMW